jgi:hypothetical protein
MLEEREFPDCESFRQQLQESSGVSGSLKQMNDFLSALSGLRFESYTDPVRRFLTSSLPTVWQLVSTLEQHSRNIDREISHFCELYASLIVASRLSPPMIISIANEFDEPTKHFQLIELPAFSPADLRCDAAARFVRKHHPPVSSIVLTFIPHIFLAGIFSVAAEELQSGHLMPHSAEAVLLLFLCIHSIVRPIYVAALLPMMIDVALIASKIGSQYVKYVTRFLHFFPERLDSTLQRFCGLAGQGSVQARYSIVSEIITITEAHGYGGSTELVKKTMLDVAADSSAHPTLLGRVFHFLPDLAKAIVFTESDLLKLLANSSSGEVHRFNCLINLVQSIQSDLNGLVQTILTQEIVFPALHCCLIERTADQKLAHQLFVQLLKSYDRILRYDLTSADLTPKVQSLVLTHSETDDVSLIPSVAQFYICAPYLPSTSSFVLRVIDLTAKYPELLDILFKFSHVLPKFDCRHLLDFVCKKTFALKSPRLTFLLSAWLNNLPRNPIEQLIFQELEKSSVLQWWDELFNLVETVIRKSVIFLEIKNLLTKLFAETVPLRRAEWAIRLMHFVLKNEGGTIQQFMRVLIVNLERPDCRLNAANMIVQEIIRESDFHDLQSSHNCFVQNVIIKTEPPIAFRCSFHPYHSTRRLYLAVAQQIKKQPGSFGLQLVEGTDQTDLPFMAPLTRCEFSSFNSLYLDVVEPSPKAVFDTSIRPYFLDALAAHPGQLAKLYEFCDELLFQVLLFFQPFQILPPPTNIFQSAIFHQVGEWGNYLGICRVFPFVVKALADSGRTLGIDATERILMNLATDSYDPVSLAVGCSAIAQISGNCCFSEKLLRVCLLETDSKVVRETVLSMVSPHLDRNVVIGLIGIAGLAGNRSKSREFFRFVKSFHFPCEIFQVFYEDLEQSETSLYSPVDQTYIGLLGLIHASKEMIALTLSRLFAAPTCAIVNKPFIHTVEAWQASFRFLLHSNVTSLIKPYLRNLPPVPSLAMKLSSDFTSKGTAGISNLGSTCYVNSLLQILNSLSLFSGKLISRPGDGLPPFVRQLRDFLAQLKFSRGSVLSIRQLVDTIPNFNSCVQEDAEEFLTMMINRIHEELGDSDDITPHLRGQFTWTVRIGDKTVASSAEEFYYLSIPAKNLSRLDQAFSRYFVEESIAYSTPGGPVQALRKAAIDRWPDYLTIQLQRWTTPSKLTNGRSSSTSSNFHSSSAHQAPTRLTTFSTASSSTRAASNMATISPSLSSRAATGSSATTSSSSISR